MEQVLSASSCNIHIHIFALILKVRILTWQIQALNLWYWTWRSSCVFIVATFNLQYKRWTCFQKTLLNRKAVELLTTVRYHVWTMYDYVTWHRVTSWLRVSVEEHAKIKLHTIHMRSLPLDLTLLSFTAGFRYGPWLLGPKRLWRLRQSPTFAALRSIENAMLKGVT